MNKELYKALSKARAEFPKIVKDSQGQRGKYAKLPDVLEVVVPVLEKNGLYLEQPTVWRDGFAMLNTRIIHIETGQSLNPYSPLPLKKVETTLVKTKKKVVPRPITRDINL